MYRQSEVNAEGQTDGVQLVSPDVQRFVGEERHAHRSNVIEQYKKNSDSNKKQPTSADEQPTSMAHVITSQDESDDGLIDEERPDINYDNTLDQVASEKKVKYRYTLKDLPHTKDLIRLFETLLVFDAWCNKEEHWEYGDDQAKAVVDRRIRVMLAMLFAIVPRYDGNGWDTSKVHALLHVTRAIQRYGSLLNCDTGVNETNHKWHSKQPAATAQKRQEHIYLPQVGKRINDLAIIDKARRHAGLASLLPIQSERIDDCELNIDCARQSTMDESVQSKSPEIEIMEKTPAFIFTIDEDLDKIVNTWNRKGTGGSYLHPSLKNYIESLMKDRKIVRVETYTEAKVGSLSFRSHPQYRGDKPWYDWCRHTFTQVDDDGNEVTGIGLAKIICFVRYTWRNGQVNECALVHYCHERDACDRAMDTLLQTNWRICYQNFGRTPSEEVWYPYFGLIQGSSIISQTFVVEESPGIHESIPRYPRVIEMLQPDAWADIFLNEDFHIWSRNLFEVRKANPP